MTSYVEPDRTQVLPLAPAEPAAPPAPVVPGSEGAVPSPAIPERSVDVIDEPTRIVPLNEPTQIVPIAVPNSAATAPTATSAPAATSALTGASAGAVPTGADPVAPTSTPPTGGETLEGETPRKRRNSPLWAKLCVILGAIVMVASGAVVVGPRLLISYATKDIPKVQALPEPPPTIDGPINILLLGMDARPEDAGANGARADTIIIAHIPATHDKIYMVSLPRDLEVDIPPFPDTNYPGQSYQKINAAFFFGAKQAGGNASVRDRPADLSPEGRGRGGALMAMTIDQLVPGGLKFNAMAIINFDGFLSILETLGGVEMCVDEAVYSIHYYPDGTRPDRGDLVGDRYGQGKYYPEGCYHMEAWEALDFARQRYGLEGGDYARQRHQQQLIKAMINKMMSRGVLTDPGKLLQLQRAAGDLLTLDLGPVSMETWLFTLGHLRPSDIVMIKTNGGKFHSVGVVEEGNQSLSEESKQLLAALSTDTVGDFVAAHPDWVAEG
jgi:LCP family protein required for cell wall assembly